MQPIIEFWRKYRSLLEFVGLVVVWPGVAYLFIYATDPYQYSNGEQGPHTALILAVVGMIAWVAVKVRRGG